MNALTASLIVALIGATAFVVATIITARARIGLLPALARRDSANTNDAATHVAIGLPEKARHFRVLGWMLVMLLCLGAIFCLLQGFGDLRIFSTGTSGRLFSAASFPSGLKSRSIPDSGSRRASC
jgi:hypothetical protein